MAGTRHRIREQLLAAVRSVASTTLVGITTDIAVRVPDVVCVFLLELVCTLLVFACLLPSESSQLTICDQFEALPPKDYALIHVHSDAL